MTQINLAERIEVLFIGAKGQLGEVFAFADWGGRRGLEECLPFAEPDTWMPISPDMWREIAPEIDQPPACGFFRSRTEIHHQEHGVGIGGAVLMSDKPDLESLVQLYADYVVAYGKACEAGLNYADSDDWEDPLKTRPLSRPKFPCC
jgi:hypothetical protein